MSFVTLQSGELETTGHGSPPWPPSDGAAKAFVLSLLITSSLTSLSHNTHFALGLFYSLTNPCETIRHGMGKGGIQLRAKTLIVSLAVDIDQTFLPVLPEASEGMRIHHIVRRI